MNSQLLAQADALYQNGQLEAAADIYARLLAAGNPGAAPFYMLGIIRAQQGRSEEALALVDGALRLDPDHPVILSARANILGALRRPEEALASCDRALKAAPALVDVLITRGNILFGLTRHQEALLSYDEALRHAPDLAIVWNNRALALRALGRFDEALEACDRTIAIDPGNAEAFSNRGNMLHDLRRFDEALTSHETALALAPDFAEAWGGRGLALLALNRLDEAAASYDKALSLSPRLAWALNGRGVVRFRARDFAAALQDYEAALAVQQDYVDALTNRGNALRALGHFDEALASFDQALAMDGASATAFAGAATMALLLCDWQRTREIGAALPGRIAAEAPLSPFTVLGYTDDKAVIMQAASNAVRHAVPVRPDPVLRSEARRDGKIRVAYLSSDFSQHPVALQIARLIEVHDRREFEIFGISTGHDDGSPIRARLMRAFDHVLDARTLTDRSVAEFLAERRVDILVDLNGHTDGARLGILAHRACPVQVTWLGYPGTSGSDFIDHMLADRIVLAPAHRKYFTESPSLLPDMFFVSDPTRNVPVSPSRATLGLPENDFVFCCFNASWKITQPLFDIWMRLLVAVPGSVLWLKRPPQKAQRSLLDAGVARGVDASRILFAEEVDLDAHLARHAAADLFLDTLPYNAHATATDALWAGLPVLTCEGQSFAGRVASSLLHAVGLPELVTRDLPDYEARARDLALGNELPAIREKLKRNIAIEPLFDIDRFRRNLETAFAVMLRDRVAGR